MTKGFVYILESTRRNGERKLYVGQTARPVCVRLYEHTCDLKHQRGTWIVRGAAVRLLGAFTS